MKPISFFFAFVCLVLRLHAAPAAEEQRFLAAVKKAFAAKDVAALSALTCWDRVPEKLMEKQKKSYANALKWSVKEVELVPPGQPDQEWKDKSGVAHKFNLTITKWLKPVFPPEAKLTIYYSVGEKDGKLFLAAPAPVK